MVSVIPGEEVIQVTTEKLLSVLVQYEDRFSSLGFEPERNTSDTQSVIAMIPHLYWMCIEAQTLVAAGHIEKAMRWLGFIQGYLHSWGMATLKEIKSHNRP